jgi:hypothetical protein
MHVNENDIIFILSSVQYGTPPSDEIWSSCWRQIPKPRRVQNRGILGSAPKNAAPQRALLRPRGAHFAPPPEGADAKTPPRSGLYCGHVGRTSRLPLRGQTQKRRPNRPGWPTGLARKSEKRWGFSARSARAAQKPWEN